VDPVEGRRDVSSVVGVEIEHCFQCIEKLCDADDDFEHTQLNKRL
jgi:hypothetical protein